MIVLDCSAAANIAQGTSEGNALRALIEKGEDVISSELLFIETASSFRKYVKLDLMTEAEALILIRDAVGLVTKYISIHENYIEAFTESLRLKHSVYDMLYLTLARRNGATLVTLDAKLGKLCEEQGVDCIHQINL
ncbi:MAG: type II toxin-antitoxin system VapC family toxin [Coriobacteriia bacterium]|nr:type II toxin-antitoxin system VapC family toxin [Coriobacteriia bacterium]